MSISRQEMLKVMQDWEVAWNNHDLEKVMDLFHEDVFFEHWHEARVFGKKDLYEAWKPWFEKHGGFRFTTEDLFIDEVEQKVLYQWLLEWLSLEKGYEGKPEKRRGVDVLHFEEGKIIKKLSYSKTRLEINGKKVKCNFQS